MPQRPGCTRRYRGPEPPSPVPRAKGRSTRDGEKARVKDEQGLRERSQPGRHGTLSRATAGEASGSAGDLDRGALGCHTGGADLTLQGIGSH